jgi:translation initiation factor 5B
MEFTIPGLLFIDTPGHAAFVNLRKRGGSIADIAVLVVDINEGFKPQTIECVEILKQSKTPFVVAANKIDLINGWQEKEGNLMQQISLQNDSVKQALDTKLYELVGKFSDHGFSSERFDRVSDYTKEIALIPTSAKTGVGLPELLMVITGLAQRYLEKCLECNVCGPAKGTILEVKEEKGRGKTLDVIIYDGRLKVNDTISIGGIEKLMVTKVRALFEPAALAEMRDKKSKFSPVKEVKAATGVKIVAPSVDEAIAGMPLRSSVESLLDKTKKEVQAIVGEVLVETKKAGIIIKADSLGSLEALTHLLREKNIPIRKASIGKITKKDLSDAESNYDEDPLMSVILGFNVQSEKAPEHVKIITSDIIYKIIEGFEKWQDEEKKRQEAGELDTLVRPCKLEVMRGYVFRQNNPAISQNPQ